MWTEGPLMMCAPVVTKTSLSVTNAPLGGSVVTESHLFVTNVLPMVDLSTGGWYFVDGRCFEGASGGVFREGPHYHKKALKF